MIFNYRQFWQEHHQQTIPAGYHIHHRDGNNANNAIENLQCVSPQEHYQIHLAEGRDLKWILYANPTDETRAKISGALKGKPKSEGTRAKMSASAKGKSKSDETKKRMSAAKKGRTPWNKGRPFAEEHRANLSAAYRRRQQQARDLSNR